MKKITFKEWFIRFFTSMKGFVAVSIVFSILIYVLIFVIPNSTVDNGEIFNALKEIAYTEAEKGNTDYKLSETLISYEVSTNDLGMKQITLVGKNNVNYKFCLTEDYEVLEITNTWKISAGVTIFSQVFVSLLFGVASTTAIIVYSVAFEWLFDKITKNKKV